MSPREANRLRKMIGAVFLGAAVIVWTMAIVMSPHSGSATAAVPDIHVSASVASFIRNSAFGTLILTVLATLLLFWKERPRKRWEDAVVIAVLVGLAASSFYQMMWIETAVLDVETQTTPIAPEEI